MTTVVTSRNDQYVLNHCTRLLARDRGPTSEPFHFPVIDTHWDGESAESSYRFNDVAFVHDGRAEPAGEVRVVGSFGELHDPVPLRQVTFLDEPWTSRGTGSCTSTSSSRSCSASSAPCGPASGSRWSPSAPPSWGSASAAA
jgi:hypothetical protein